MTPSGPPHRRHLTANGLAATPFRTGGLHAEACNVRHELLSWCQQLEDMPHTSTTMLSLAGYSAPSGDALARDEVAFTAAS